MKKYKFLIILAAALTVLAAAASCVKNDVPSGPPATIPPDVRVEYPAYSGNNGGTITTAANYANTVSGYYNGNGRSQYIAENMFSKLTYDLFGTDGKSGLQTLENTKGGVYVSETMDTFLKTAGGTTFFASSQSRANLFDQGFYYYNLHFLDQTFGETSYEKKALLENDDCFRYNDVEKPVVNSDGSYTFKITSSYDPYVCFRLPEEKYAIEEYDAFSVTMKTSSSDATVYYIAGDDTEFSSDAKFDFKTIPDGEFHTYTVNFTSATALRKFLKAYRLDVGGGVGGEIAVKDFSLVKMDSSLPPVKLDRCYNVYPDKIHENIRLVAFGTYNELGSVGTVTRIPADRVSSLLVISSDGSHDSIEGVNWDLAYSVAFDITDAGVFGIILGTDEKYAGKLTVEKDGADYVVTQEVDCGGVTLRKGGDLYFARRIYTDETHDFAGFIKETGFERSPVEFTVDKDGSGKKNKYTGYDQLTGAYVFSLSGVNDFDFAYTHPLAEHRVRFEAAAGEEPRTVYVRGETSTDGCLECAVVLDENDVLLPVRVEVCKNFAFDGEERFYTDNDSHSYGLSVFPMTVVPGGSNKLTLANLYEQWGNYRLKQISSIRWHSAYYHLSLGVTETNCIHFYGTENRLPDHRGLSSLYWADEMIDVLDANGNKTGEKRIYGQQPQHSNNGNHFFLNYTDADGNYNSCENIGMTKIDSAGPDLADLTLKYTSYDGKVYQTYRHVEMPSTDENRAFYDVEYVFLDNVKINDVASDLCLYKFEGTYERFGYLDKNNESVIDDALKTGTRLIELGDDHPYFDYFRMVSHKPGAYVEADVSSNLSILIDEYDVTLAGKPYTGGLAVLEGNNSAALTLNMSGSYTFRKGDRIRLRFILMPWGNYYSLDDENVRMVRVNTLLNPIKIESASGTVKEDFLVPTVRSADGKSCEFTVSGGFANVRDLPGYATSEYTKYKVSWERDYNVTFRIEGMKEPGVPKIYEKTGDGWTEYQFASELGYDGYTVTYAADGTFTYGFTATMTDAAERTFKIEVG